MVIFERSLLVKVRFAISSTHCSVGSRPRRARSAASKAASSASMSSEAADDATGDCPAIGRDFLVVYAAGLAVVIAGFLSAALTDTDVSGMPGLRGPAKGNTQKLRDLGCSVVFAL